MALGIRFIRKPFSLSSAPKLSIKLLNWPPNIIFYEFRHGLSCHSTWGLVPIGYCASIDWLKKEYACVQFLSNVRMFPFDYAGRSILIPDT